MRFLTREKLNQIIEEFERAVCVKVRDSRERKAKEAYVLKVKNGVKEIIEIGRAPGAKVYEYIDPKRLADLLKKICLAVQRNKQREINWTRELLLIVEEKTGEEILPEVEFPPEGVNVDDPASRQGYIHEKKVDSNLDESQQRFTVSKLVEDCAEELWCSEGTIWGDWAVVKHFSDISTNLPIKIDINVTQCADLLRSLFQQRGELMSIPSSYDLTQQVWHQLQPSIQEKIKSFFEILGEEDLIDYLMNLKEPKMMRKSEWDNLCAACLPVEGRSGWMRFPKDEIKNAYLRFMKIGLRDRKAYIQLKSTETFEGFIRAIKPISFHLEQAKGESKEIFIEEIADFQLKKF